MFCVDDTRVTVGGVLNCQLFEIGEHAQWYDGGHMHEGVMEETEVENAQAWQVSRDEWQSPAGGVNPRYNSDEEVDVVISSSISSGDCILSAATFVFMAFIDVAAWFPIAPKKANPTFDPVVSTCDVASNTQTNCHPNFDLNRRDTDSMGQAAATT